MLSWESHPWHLFGPGASSNTRHSYTPVCEVFARVPQNRPTKMLDGCHGWNFTDLRRSLGWRRTAWPSEPNELCPLLTLGAAVCYQLLGLHV